MKQYTITKFKDWQSVPVINIDTPYGDKPEDIFAYGQVAYTDQAILVHLRAVEKNIRSEENDVLGMPCRDSCLEFFFCPNSDELRYFNIEFNPVGCMFLGFGSSPKNLTRLVIDPKELFDLNINKTDDAV